MTYRNRKALDLSRQIPCRATFKHDCTSLWPGEDGKYLSVPAHTNELKWGRGCGHKAPDPFFAAVCPPAHDFIDGRRGGWDKETKHAEWLHAYIGTQLFMWEQELVRVA